MTTVFLSGSRRISRLNEEIRTRLHNIIEQNYRIVLGDANGADKAIQKYLADVRYPNVIVYCSGNSCRNNIGNWEANKIQVGSQFKGRDFYTQKDIKMADDADYGFMLWDGKSIGTINNIIEILKRNKKAIVYLSPEKKFFSISSVKDAREFLSQCNQETLISLDKKTKISRSLNELEKGRQLLLNF